MEAFFGDGVIRVEFHQNRVARRVHFLRRLLEERRGHEDEDRGPGLLFPSPSSPAIREAGGSRLPPGSPSALKQEDSCKLEFNGALGGGGGLPRWLWR